MKEENLLIEYLADYVDKMKPVSLNMQIAIFTRSGYICEGHNGKTFPSFETWKQYLN